MGKNYAANGALYCSLDWICLANDHCFLSQASDTVFPWGMCSDCWPYYFMLEEPTVKA
jgi:hypothetical protein